MSNSLASMRPELVREWSDKNLPLMPDKITYGSNKIVWWKAACGHEWQSSVKARSKGENCLICSGARVIEGINDLATLRPELAQEWSVKNEIKPTEVSIGSHKKVIFHSEAIVPNFIEQQITEEYEENRYQLKMKLLDKAFTGLTEKQYKYLISRYVANKSAREIAKEKGVSHQAIEKHLNAAVKKVKKIFAEFFRK